MSAFRRTVVYGWPLTWKLWRPLWRNVRVLLRSRPLALSVVGIAYFACLTLYARQTLIYDGEAAKEGASPLAQNKYKLNLIAVAVKRALLIAAGAKKYWEV